MSFKGSVESFSLADVFQNLSMNQQTGTLSVVASPGQEKHIFFKEGHICFLTVGGQQPLAAARGLPGPRPGAGEPVG